MKADLHDPILTLTLGTNFRQTSASHDYLAFAINSRIDDVLPADERGHSLLSFAFEKSQIRLFPDELRKSVNMFEFSNSWKNCSETKAKIVSCRPPSRLRLWSN